MQDTATKIASVDWQSITGDMHNKGFAFIPNILTSKQCGELKENYDNPGGYRKTVVMERYRFGLGEYKYFDYPLPGLIQTIRETVYPRLAPIANTQSTIKSHCITTKERRYAPFYHQLPAHQR